MLMAWARSMRPKVARERLSSGMFKARATPRILVAVDAAARSSSGVKGRSGSGWFNPGKWLTSIAAALIRRQMWDSVPVAGVAPSLRATSRSEDEEAAASAMAASGYLRHGLRLTK
ncbi:hypothetical protein ACIQ9J_28375 [Streptomyces sp. NPDC094153]|uniref:hypothetical protein n=1 Tax=Streptomyces sp. NPDC094153 TaxID=3366058 RepID=UPI00380F1759